MAYRVWAEHYLSRSERLCAPQTVMPEVKYVLLVQTFLYAILCENRVLMVVTEMRRIPAATIFRPISQLLQTENWSSQPGRI
jgi:hypothetical protein